MMKKGLTKNGKRFLDDLNLTPDLKNDEKWNGIFQKIELERKIKELENESTDDKEDWPSDEENSTQAVVSSVKNEISTHDIDKQPAIIQSRATQINANDFVHTLLPLLKSTSRDKAIPLWANISPDQYPILLSSVTAHIRDEETFATLCDVLIEVENLNLPAIFQHIFIPWMSKCNVRDCTGKIFASVANFIRKKGESALDSIALPMITTNSTFLSDFSEDLEEIFNVSRTVQTSLTKKFFAKIESDLRVNHLPLFLFILDTWGQLEADLMEMALDVATANVSKYPSNADFFKISLSLASRPLTNTQKDRLRLLARDMKDHQRNRLLKLLN